MRRLPTQQLSLPLGDVRSPLKFAVLASPPRPITQKAAKVANRTYLRAAANAALALRQYPPRRPFILPAALPKPHDAVGEASPCS